MSGVRGEGQGANASPDSYPFPLTPYPSPLSPYPYSRSLVLAAITTATFTDLVAYSVAAPVLPDYAERFHATPTVVGLLFAAFGATLLICSIPMGAVSDRMGRKNPMMCALALLAAATTLFAYAHSLRVLFIARMMQGAADAMTWVVGFALIADLYGPDERGRAMGLTMAGSMSGFIVGPFVGGWLYEIGGIRLPFLAVTGLTLADLIVFSVVTPQTSPDRSTGSMWDVLRVRAIAICGLIVIAGAATAAMLEPVMPLRLELRLGLGPRLIGIVFGTAAIVSAAMHPIYGHFSDRWGGRRLMLAGMIGSALVLPMLSLAASFRSAIAVMVIMQLAFGMFVTPSMAYFAQLASYAGVTAYGVVYGVYNMAWAVGLMAGPAIGGFLFERIGFTPLMIVWSVMLLAAAWVLRRAPR